MIRKALFSHELKQGESTWTIMSIWGLPLSKALLPSPPPYQELLRMDAQIPAVVGNWYYRS